MDACHIKAHEFFNGRVVSGQDFCTYMTPFVKGKLFAPLYDVLDGNLKDSFVKGTTEAYAIDNKTYGLPLELNIAPIYYKSISCSS